MAGKISAIIPGSIAESKHLHPGDYLLEINGRQLNDLIDYNYTAYEDELTLLLRRADGTEQKIKLRKDAGEDLGLVFEAEVFDGIRSCRNRCLFCFIDQLHEKPRQSLLLKDDDYRMSFLEGNFITGTNLSATDIQRIVDLRLSPLYISVHCTNPGLRGHMLGLKKPAPILPLLQELTTSGVSVHTQIVLCPGINDGAVLEQTIAELAALHPGVESIAIVPVGLTRFQRRRSLRFFTQEEAAALLDWLKPLQTQFLQQYGTRFVFAADEIYIRAGRDFPKPGHYEEFVQLENGVGLAALFSQEWRFCRRRLARYGLPPQTLVGKTGLVTGISGAAVLAVAMPDIEAASQGRVELLPIENSFFGPTITVTGLLTGSCLIKVLPVGQYSRYIIPNNMLKHGSRLFLDDMTVDEVAEILQTAIIVAENNAKGLYEALITQ